jgi:hypothetical protein
VKVSKLSPRSLAAFRRQNARMRSEAHGDCSGGGRDADAHSPTRDIIHVLDLPDLRVTCTKAFRLVGGLRLISVANLQCNDVRLRSSPR